VVPERGDPAPGQACEQRQRLVVLGQAAVLGEVAGLKVQRRRAEPLDVGAYRL
jgi:hypothetical protein